MVPLSSCRCTGPFKLAKGGYVRGQSVTLERHDAYYEPGKPYLDGVVFQFGVSPSSAKHKFLTGELDTLRALLRPRMTEEGDPTPTDALRGMFVEIERLQQTSLSTSNITILGR